MVCLFHKIIRDNKKSEQVNKENTSLGVEEKNTSVYYKRS